MCAAQETVDMRNGMNHEIKFKNTDDLKPRPVGRILASVSGEFINLNTFGNDHNEAVLFEIPGF